MSSSTSQQDAAAAAAGGGDAPGMINPHNPEFLTKKPWYLSGGADGDAAAVGDSAAGGGTTLDHQADQRLDKDRLELSVSAAEAFLEEQRRKEKQRALQGSFEKGQWVEALKKNRHPYLICQILAIRKNGTEFDLQYEDGSIERKVKFSKKSSSTTPRIRMTKSGSRAAQADAAVFGKETFDSKRDQYHGYDRDSYNKRITAKFEQRDAIRRKLREQQQQQQQKSAAEGKDKETSNGKEAAPSDSDFGDSDSDNDDNEDNDDADSEDEFVQRDEDAKVVTTRLARQGGVGGAQMKMTARNLRIREDTAKYLRNLDPNSAYYDPKSRSMRDNPTPYMAPEESDFVGDNFTRISGDAVGLAQTQIFAWDASTKGVNEIHPQANPSQAEVLKKEFQSKSQNLKQQQKKAILDKYGGQEYLDGTAGLAAAVDKTRKTEQQGKAPSTSNSAAAAKEAGKLRFGVSTTKEEYSRDGRLLKSGSEKIKHVPLESKYEEDVFVNGHTTVWGSYFHKGAFQWGYADDHSLLKNSYCTGETGRIANDESNEMQYGTGKAGSAALAQARGMLTALGGGRASNKESTLTANSLVSRSKLYGEADPNAVFDEGKVQQALKKSKKQAPDTADDRKRKYHSMNAEVDLSQEDMEAYRLQKERRNDPMEQINSDELLEYKK